MGFDANGNWYPDDEVTVGGDGSDGSQYGYDLYSDPNTGAGMVDNQGNDITYADQRDPYTDYSVSGYGTPPVSDQQLQLDYTQPDVTGAPPVMPTPESLPAALPGEVPPTADPNADPNDPSNQYVTNLPDRSMTTGQTLATSIASAIPLILGAFSKNPYNKIAGGNATESALKLGLDINQKQNAAMAISDKFNAENQNKRILQKETREGQQQLAKQRILEQESARTAQYKNQRDMADYNDKLKRNFREDFPPVGPKPPKEAETVATNPGLAALATTIQKNNPKLFEGITPEQIQSMDLDTLKQFQVSAKEQGVGDRATAQRMRKVEDSKVTGFVNANNLKKDPNDDADVPAAFDNKTREQLMAADNIVPEILRKGKELKLLLQPEQTLVIDGKPVTVKVPQDALVGTSGSGLKDQAYNKVINRRNQILDDLVNTVKKKENFGAAFSIFEINIVKNMLGASSADATPASFLSRLKDKVQGKDYASGIDSYMQDATKAYFNTINSSRAVFDPYERATDINGREFMQNLRYFGGTPYLNDSMKRINDSPFYGILYKEKQ